MNLFWVFVWLIFPLLSIATSNRRLASLPGLELAVECCLLRGTPASVLKRVGFRV